ncbi:MAG: PDZ domain-containing protein [bacterium]|nr:PDZ domain-containing protein [bacterium]
MKKITVLITAAMVILLQLSASGSEYKQNLAQNTQQASQAEISFWESVKDTKEADELEAYLQVFPKGQFVPLARIRLKKLKTSTASAPASGDTGKIPGIIDLVKDSIVSISTKTRGKSDQKTKLPPDLPDGHPLKKFFKKFGDMPGKARPILTVGSGFIVEQNGEIVVPYSLVNGADSIEVTLTDGTNHVVTKVLGKDVRTDLALLKIEPATALKSIKFSTPNLLKLGERIIVIGYPLGKEIKAVPAFATELNDAIPSVFGRFIRTDADTGSGMSGAAIVNLRGEVVGQLIEHKGPTGKQQHAQPARSIEPVIMQLRKFGEMRRGWLGVQIQKVSENMVKPFGLSRAEGSMLANIIPGGPASKAGLKAGDIILEIEGKRIKDMYELAATVAAIPPGTKVNVKLWRDGKEKTLTVKLGKKPPPTATKQSKSTGQFGGGVVKVSGLTLENMTSKMRTKYKLSSGKFKEGVVVTGVVSGSTAAKKGLQAGDVINEVRQEEVHSTQDVVKHLTQLKRKGRKHALFLLSDRKGELKFVALPIGNMQIENAAPPAKTMKDEFGDIKELEKLD